MSIQVCGTYHSLLENCRKPSWHVKSRLIFSWREYCSHAEIPWRRATTSEGQTHWISPASTTAYLILQLASQEGLWQVMASSSSVPILSWRQSESWWYSPLFCDVFLEHFFIESWSNNFSFHEKDSRASVSCDWSIAINCDGATIIIKDVLIFLLVCRTNNVQVAWGCMHVYFVTAENEVPNEPPKCLTCQVTLSCF